MAGFENNVVVGVNLNFDNDAPPAHLGILNAPGKLAIGTGNVRPVPEILGGNIVSTTLTIGYSSPNITIETAGGGNPVEQITVDNSTVPGTNPVVPSSGNITITGAQIANASIANVIQTHSFAANSFAVAIQRSTTSAATDATKNGVSHYDSSRFTVDANGFVSVSGSGIGQTITGDSGGALSPSSGNWNVLGRSGSKTSGSGSTLTIKSPPYSDQGGTTTVTLNSGSFVTAAITLTLPASAGLADGDLFEFVCTTADVLIIQAVDAQKIRLGSSISSAAGTLTSTAIGDAVVLRFRATDGFFYATSSIGNWTIA
jgi:hypothetical protein